MVEVKFYIGAKKDSLGLLKKSPRDALHAGVAYVYICSKPNSVLYDHCV